MANPKRPVPGDAPDNGMRPEYDFSDGVRGKYAEQFRKGTNVVLLDPEVAKAFPDSKSVNDALRAILAVATRIKTSESPNLPEN